MIIQSKRVWLGESFVPAQIQVENGLIEAVLRYGEKPVDCDMGNERLLPGFIDIHTHGSYGFDTNDGTPGGLRDWMLRITEEGVTAILPTTVTQFPDVLIKALSNVASVVEEGYEGAEILGVHLEGPFIDTTKKGAQPEKAIAKPSVSQFKLYQDAAKGLIKYITLSPEHDDGYALTSFCAKNGVTVSIGHSIASYDEALFAIANGASSMTHVYNGMTGLHHRDIGLVGTALSLHELYGEIIGDGMHVTKEMVKLFFDQKGKDHGIMITDSLRAKHCEPGGVYDLGGQEIEIDERGLARIKGTDTIAGSTLSMNKGLRFLVEEAKVDEVTAINAVTINPARALKVDSRKGRIRANYDADIVALSDEYDVLCTWCRGKKFSKQK